MNGINSSTGNANGITEWISQDLNFSVIDVSRESATIAVSNYGKYRDIFLSDSSRFAIASVESFSSISKNADYKKLAAWNLVIGYYASYYAIHSIMRLSGSSCTYLDPKTIVKFNRIARESYGFSVNLSTGYYYISRQNINGSTILSITKKPSDDGTHEFAWQSFDQWIRQAVLQIKYTQSISTADRDGMINVLRDLSKAIYKRNSDGFSGESRLSTIRNNINYKMSYGVWHPYKGSLKNIEELVDIQSEWRGRINAENIKSLDFGRIKTEDAQILESYAHIHSFFGSLIGEIIKDVLSISDINRKRHPFSKPRYFL